MIIDYQGNTLSKKFDRFFNYGECPEITGKVDFNNCVIESKEDGSLIGIWYDPYASKWQISTRKRAMAEGEFVHQDDTKTTFREVVLESFGVTEDEFQQKIDSIGVRDETYLFEFCHPESRIVTKYEKPTIFFMTVTCGSKDLSHDDGLITEIGYDFQECKYSKT